jgi:drug/metabolite transporter (DMT)-like permease
MSPSQWLLLILLSVLWGASFLTVGIATRELPAFTIVLARVAIAAAVLAPLMLALGHRIPLTRHVWQTFLIMAVLNNLIPFTLIVTGQKEIASGLASVLNATTPLWGVIFAHLFTADEKLVANRLAGVLIGLAGVAVLVGIDAMLGNASSLFGAACILGAAMSYGVSGLWGRRLKDTPPMVSAVGQLTCSTLLLIPLALIVDRPWQLAMPSREAVLALLVLAVLATALAYVVFFRIMAVSGPANVMLVTLLIPISAIAFGHFYLGEPVHVRQLAGAAVIALGLIVLDGRLLKPWRSV